jgi:hypothetical protein
MYHFRWLTAWHTGRNQDFFDRLGVMAKDLEAPTRLWRRDRKARSPA